ncbi:ankyrin repeat-containing protein [Acrasis kona]|uniref:Ankyrin repeat-containing protein n=1 Tax=Acrasis kona TaxID=1008807 RepID=A0AAW2ZQF7_9EUKA
MAHHHHHSHDHQHDENCNHDHEEHEHDENCDHEHDDDEHEEHVHGEHCNHHHTPKRKVPKHNQPIPPNVVPQNHKHDTYDDYLQCAISRLEYNEVKILLDHYNGADVGKYINETRFDDFQSPISLACFAGSLPLVKLFVELGASVEDSDNDETGIASCFFYACFSNKPDIELVKYIYQKSPKMINTPHRKANYTPLMAACQKADLRVVTFLISNGADVNADGARGLTPLMVSLDGMCDPHRDQKQHLNSGLVAMHIIKSGADVNYQSNLQFTALWRACMKRQGDQIKLLITANADVNVRCYDMSPAYAIIKSEDEEPHNCGGHHHHNVVPQTKREDCLKLLIDTKKLNLDTIDEGTHTPLSLALENGYKAIATLLLENGANPKRQVAPNIPTSHDLIMSGRDQDLKTTLQLSYGCSVCKKKGSLLRCSRCQKVWYCTKECQLKDWSTHKNECKTK